MLTDMSIAIPVDFRILADFLIFAPDFRVGKGKITPWLTAEYIRGRIIRRKSGETFKKSQKLQKRYLTKKDKGGIIDKLSQRGRQRMYRIREPKSSLKKVEKTFKKGIDKGERKWYNRRAVAKSGSGWSLKIEQQETSTKHCKVRNTKSRQRVIYTQQSKRS